MPAKSVFIKTKKRVIINLLLSHIKSFRVRLDPFTNSFQNLGLP